MKYKTTAKAIRQGLINVKCAGYCDLEFILRNHEPIAYTCGIYGWNFDIYEVYGVTITTGYRGMVGERAKGIIEYNEKARAIWEDYDNPNYKGVDGWERQRNEVETLLKEFCKLNGGKI